ncbi:hypothetical protein Ddc_15641 [Ditylenchus destructor]|nr:hypothetical protein Ddc_15641 [Ditylenchus destructor]
MLSLKTATIATLVFAVVLAIDSASVNLPNNVVGYGSSGSSNVVTAVLQQRAAECSICNVLCSDCQALGGTCANCQWDDACTFCNCQCVS